MRISPRFAGLSLLALAALFWSGRPARACSPPICRVLRFPTARSSVPANLVAFPVLLADPGKLILRRASGEIVPASIKMLGPDLVFSPDVVLDEETAYEVVSSCAAPAAMLDHVFWFTTSRARAPSAASGQLAVEEEGIAFPGHPNGEAVFARVRFLSGDLGADGPVISTPFVDGHEVPWDPYQLPSAGFIVPVQAQCSPPAREFLSDTCGTVFSVPARKVTLAVKSHLLGSLQDPPPATIELDLRCDRTFATTAATTGSSPPDAGAAPADPAPQPGGCAYLPGPRPSGALLLTGLLGLALLGARRRRR